MTDLPAFWGGLTNDAGDWGAAAADALGRDHESLHVAEWLSHFGRAVGEGVASFSARADQVTLATYVDGVAIVDPVTGLRLDAKVTVSGASVTLAVLETGPRGRGVEHYPLMPGHAWPVALIHGRACSPGEAAREVVAPWLAALRLFRARRPQASPEITSIQGDAHATA